MKKITLPISKEDRLSLRAGEKVRLTGVLYTARDLAHQKLVKMKKLPIPIKDQIIFYAGPTPGKKSPVLAIGPTTASRMDPFVEPLLKLGMAGTIGKGPRSSKAKELFLKHKAIYFVATGGTAALLGTKVKKSEYVAFKELGPEGIIKIEVEDFPVIVAYDSIGGDIFESR